MDWNLILNWRLLNGSHKFPGPEGGTCINEAAIVAAGLEYRAIQSADDCPPCFSRVIAGYALRLNDAMGDELRQELLMPYVVRLAGTADVPEVEVARARHIALETIRRILPIALRAAELNNHAARCAGVKYLSDAAAAAAAAASAAAAAASAAAAVRAAVYDAAAVAARAATRAAAARDAAAAAYAAASAAAAVYAAVYDADAAAARAAVYAADAVAVGKEIFMIAVAILDEAICLGKQADPIEIGVVTARMEAAKQRRKLVVPVTETV